MHQLLQPPITLTAPVVQGAGRGKRLKIPTLNLPITDLPPELKQGIYACRVFLPGSKNGLMGAMHFGPRPVFNDSETLEVHLLDTQLDEAPQKVTLEVIAWLREVKNFPDAQALKAEIAHDIALSRAILSAHDPQA